MATTAKDIIKGITFIKETFASVNENKTTKICANDIANYIAEWYPEAFENISTDYNAFARFEYSFGHAHYYSFTEMAIELLANNETDYYACLAYDYGYDSFDEMCNDYLVLCDVAIDGFLVLE